MKNHPIPKKLVNLIAKVQAEHPKWSKPNQFIYLVNASGGIKIIYLSAICRMLKWRI
jgi:hypothetical protein